MKYYIIAGEASGDLHGSNLIKALKMKDPQADIRAWGGDLMAEAGADIRKHYRDLAFMGFLEVVKNLRTILRNMSFCKEDILAFQPDVIIFIDYPGFNLRIAKWAKQQNFKTFYYISPQIWAWHTSRVHGIKATIDRMFCILPFEKDFYRQFDYEVDFVGHPLLDVINNVPQSDLATFKAKNGLDERPIIALLPGSRRQEIEKMLSIMLSVQPHFIDYQFIVAAASAHSLQFFDHFLKQTEGVKIVQNQTYDLLQHATAALVKSGTSTLETALFGVPEVVCYKGSKLSFAIAKRVIKVKYISLVNLIADREIVKELIQDDLNTNNLISELKKAIDNQEIIKKDYVLLRGMLGNRGASEKTAEWMWQYLNQGQE
ncbi:MAG: lipid-A-disaccharide synthase [Saprospiraceae bacterium]|nr:lipid-A-disaccharide synthase [Saprospiraceae bacterium]